MLYFLGGRRPGRATPVSTTAFVTACVATMVVLMPAARAIEKGDRSLAITQQRDRRFVDKHISHFGSLMLGASTSAEAAHRLLEQPPGLAHKMIRTYRKIQRGVSGTPLAMTVLEAVLMRGKIRAQARLQQSLGSKSIRPETRHFIADFLLRRSGPAAAVLHIDRLEEISEVLGPDEGGQKGIVGLVEHLRARGANYCHALADRIATDKDLGLGDDGRKRWVARTIRHLAHRIDKDNRTTREVGPHELLPTVRELSSLAGDHDTARPGYGNTADTFDSTDFTRDGHSASTLTGGATETDPAADSLCVDPIRVIQAELSASETDNSEIDRALDTLAQHLEIAEQRHVQPHERDGTLRKLLTDGEATRARLNHELADALAGKGLPYDAATLRAIDVIVQTAELVEQRMAEGTPLVLEVTPREDTLSVEAPGASTTTPSLHDEVSAGPDSALQSNAGAADEPNIEHTNTPLDSLHGETEDATVRTPETPRVATLDERVALLQRKLDDRYGEKPSTGTKRGIGYLARLVGIEPAGSNIMDKDRKNGLRRLANLTRDGLAELVDGIEAGLINHGVDREKLSQPTGVIEAVVGLAREVNRELGWVNESPQAAAVEAATEKRATRLLETIMAPENYGIEDASGDDEDTNGEKGVRLSSGTIVAMSYMAKLLGVVPKSRSRLNDDDRREGLFLLSAMTMEQRSSFLDGLGDRIGREFDVTGTRGPASVIERIVGFADQIEREAPVVEAAALPAAAPEAARPERDADHSLSNDAASVGAL